MLETSLLETVRIDMEYLNSFDVTELLKNLFGFSNHETGDLLEQRTHTEMQHYELGVNRRTVGLKSFAFLWKTGAKHKARAQNRPSKNCNLMNIVCRFWTLNCRFYS